MNLIRNEKYVVDTYLYTRWIKMSLFIVLLFFIFIPQVHASTSTTTNQSADQKVQTVNTPTVSVGFVPLAPIPGLTKGVDANTQGLATFLNNLYKFILGLSAVLAVIYIIWGGLEIATQDSISKHEVGKQRIEQAILGLVLVLSPVIVFTIINPSILNLSLNLPPLDMKSTNNVILGSHQTRNLEGSCTTKGEEGILQTAVCHSYLAAIDWGKNSCIGGKKLQITAYGSTVYAGYGTPYLVTCSGTRNYTFVDLKTNDSYTTFRINELRPLAQTKADPNNGASAIQFAKTCADAGKKTCISKESKTPCLKEISASKGTCYKEVLSCNTGGLLSGSCVNNPAWTPYK